MSDDLSNYGTGGGIIATVIGVVAGGLRLSSRLSELEVKVQAVAEDVAALSSSAASSGAELRRQIQELERMTNKIQESGGSAAVTLIIKQELDLAEAKLRGEFGTIAARVQEIRETVAHLSGSLAGPRTNRGGR